MRENNKERLSATTLASADGANTIIRKAEKQKERGRAGWEIQKAAGGSKERLQSSASGSRSSVTGTRSGTAVEIPAERRRTSVLFLRINVCLPGHPKYRCRSTRGNRLTSERDSHLLAVMTRSPRAPNKTSENSYFCFNDDSIALSVTLKC